MPCYPIAPYNPYCTSFAAPYLQYPWTMEQLGTSFTSLRFQILCVDLDTPWGLKNKCLLSHLTNRLPLSRYPAVDSMYAKRVVQGMLHNLMGLSSSLQTHPSIFISNLSPTVWEMQRNNYPTPWWWPKIHTTYRCLSQSSLPPWNEFFTTLPWIPVVPPIFCTFFLGMVIPRRRQCTEAA